MTSRRVSMEPYSLLMKRREPRPGCPPPAERLESLGEDAIITRFCRQSPAAAGRSRPPDGTWVGKVPSGGRDLPEAANRVGAGFTKGSAMRRVALPQADPEC